MTIVRRCQLVAAAIVIVVASSLALCKPAIATGPRVTPSLLSPEKNEIFALEMPPFATADIPGGGLFTEIVLEALKAKRVDAVIETLPLTRLVKYYLLHEVSLAVLADGRNLTGVERKGLIVVPFYVISGRYFYYKPAHKDLVQWNARLEHLRGHTCGAGREEKVDKDPQGTVHITYDRPIMLFRNLKRGSLDIVSAPDLVTQWIIGTQFPGERQNFGTMETAGWEVPASIIFNKRHPEGEVTARKFIQGLSAIIRNGRYNEILEKFHGKGQIPANYKDRLEYYRNKEVEEDNWSPSQ